VRHGRDARALLQEHDVLRPGAEVVVRDDRTVGATTELAVLRGVHQLVQTALRNLGGILEVCQQVFLGAVEDLDLDVLAEVRSVDEELQPAPGRLELLERGVVEDLVELLGELLIDLRDQCASTKALSTFSLRAWA
jgi:hypothetical protein